MTSRATGFDVERATLEKAFFAGFKGEDGQSPFPVVAEALPAPDAKGKPWGRLTVRPGTVDLAEIGSEMRRNPGALYLQMFLPQNTGTKLALTAGDLFSEVFDLASFDLPGDAGSIRCDVASINPVGVDAATKLMQVNASVTYTREVFVLPPPYLERCAKAAWSYPSRALHFGVGATPGTDAQRYAAAIWAHAPRTIVS